MKKTVYFLMAIVMVVSLLTFSVSAAPQGKIFVDLVEVVTDVPAQTINNRTMVPVRAITEMIGYDVYWRAEKKQVEVCEKGDTVPLIVMEIDSTRVYYSKYEEELGDYVGVEAILDTPATIINNRTFVPLRFVSEAVGYSVEYIEETRDVHLFSPEYIKNHEGEGKGETPEGVDSDGIGTVVPLTDEEKTYLLSVTTEKWLDMSKEDKDALVVLIGRWREYCENIIVEDYDDMVKVIDHQMEQYFKNGVNESLFDTVCEIYTMDRSLYTVK